MTNARRTRFDVLVGDASEDLTTSRATRPHEQGDTSKNVVPIRFTMEGLDIEAYSSSATISYERLNPIYAVKNFRWALVNIRVSWDGTDAFGAGSCLFAGRVVGQTITHDRVTLTCDGLDTIAGKLPALGVDRLRVPGTGMSTNTITCMNEAGKPDMRGDPITGLENDRLADGADNTWGSFEAAVMAAERIKATMASSTTGQTFRFDQVKDLGIDPLKCQRMDKNETRPSGIFDLIQDAAAQNGMIFVTLVDTSDEVAQTDGVKLYGSMKPTVYERFDDGSKKNITWNKWQTIAGGDLDGKPWEMTLTHDNSQATRLIGYSGKRMVSTVLEIDPSNATYTETTTDENGKPILRFHAAGYQSSRTSVYESGKDRWGVFGASKWDTFGAVQPRITNHADIDTGAALGNIVEPVYAEQEKIWKFKAGVFPTSPVGSPAETCPFSTSSEILQGGDYWEDAKWFASINTEGLDMLDKLDVKFAQDSLDVTISGFVVNDNSDTAGITVEQFKAIVSRLLLPVTVECDDREVALSENLNQFGDPESMFTATKVTATGDTPGFTLKHTDHQYAHRMFDQIRPVRRVDDLDEFTPGTMSYLRVDGVETDMQDILQQQTNNELTAIVNGDGSALEFTIPVELFPLVAGKTFPAYFGEWLDDISDHQAGANVFFAGYEIPRPLIVASKSYSQTDVRITLK